MNNKVFKVSAPTTNQTLAGLVRVVAVFVGAFFSFLSLSNYSLTKVVLSGAVLAGITAVVNLVVSIATTL